MKYAVIADIHANSASLLAVLSDAKAQGAAQYLICGDYFMCMPWANETVELIRSIPNARVIFGNEDRYYDKCIGKDLYHPKDAQFLALYWAYRELSEENRVYIEALPEKIEFCTGGVSVFMSHGADTWLAGKPEERLTSKAAEYFKHVPYSDEAYRAFIERVLEENEELQRGIANMQKGIYLFGHSHLQWNYEKNDRIFINPGSCGFSLDGNPVPAYSLLEIEENGCWRITERRVPYDLTRTVDLIRRSDLYAFAQIWCELVIKEMETGYEKIAFFLKFVEAYAEEIGDPVRPYREKTWRAAYERWVASDFDRHM